MNNRYEMVIFSGGRGAASIVSALVNVKEVKLTIILNAYDDGLSTGFMRKLVPGMLGPSDIRKAFSNVLLSSKEYGNSLLGKLLEYRIGGVDEFGNCWDSVKLGGNLGNYWNGRPFLDYYFEQLPTRIARKSEVWTQMALDFLSSRLGSEDIQNSITDAAFGNLLFVGAYIEQGKDFNGVIGIWNSLFNPHANILNVSNGENRVLVALKDDGQILNSEAEIVGKHEKAGKIKRIFLLNEYLTEFDLQKLKKLSITEKIRFLESIESLPTLNLKVKSALETAQMIVYGPGTQHSSLFPSYMTRGIADTIYKNFKAEKVFISNIGIDNDIVGEDYESLVEKLTKYMNFGRIAADNFSSSDLISHSIVSVSGEVQFQRPGVSSKSVSFAEWASDDWKHDGYRVSRALLTLASMNEQLFLQQSLKSISIVIPVLNEVRTLESVINKVITFDWIGEGFTPQILVVDGGSTDGSLEYLKGVSGITLIDNSGRRGRGSAIRSGLMAATGDVVVTFPADNEYQVRCIVDVAHSLMQSEKGIVFGSRSTFCIDTDSRLREIYGGRTREYFTSKWGGFLLSSVSAVRYRRWISDPLTSVKGFRNLNGLHLSLQGDSLDWDTRVIADSWKREIPIREIAVEYSPRTIAQGKKTTIRDGLRALWGLLTSNRM